MFLWFERTNIRTIKTFLFPSFKCCCYVHWYIAEKIPFGRVSITITATANVRRTGSKNLEEAILAVVVLSSLVSKKLKLDFKVDSVKAADIFCDLNLCQKLSGRLCVRK